MKSETRTNLICGRDGALRRPRRRAKRQATERTDETFAPLHSFRPLLRGRGHRSAMSLPFFRA